MTVIGWRIYYPNSVVSSLDVSWREAATEDVQVVVVFYSETYERWVGDERRVENYREVLHGEDYYWIEGREPRTGSAADAEARADDGTVKVGRALDDDAFQAVYNAALADRVW